MSLTGGFYAILTTYTHFSVKVTNNFIEDLVLNIEEQGQIHIFRLQTNRNLILIRTRGDDPKVHVYQENRNIRSCAAKTCALLSYTIYNESEMKYGRRIARTPDIINNNN